MRTDKKSLPRRKIMERKKKERWSDEEFKRKKERLKKY